MQLTVVHLAKAAHVTGAGLIAFAMAFVADRMIGHDNPIVGAAIAAIIMILGLVLVRRYERGFENQVDAPRRRIRLASTIAAGAVLAVLAMFAAEWMWRPDS